MAKIEVPSGAEVIINAASFEAAKLLERAILRETGLSGINSLANVVSTALTVVSAESVNAALWPCLARCLYEKEKITMNTFDKAERRKDFYPVAQACIEENIGPLFDGLRSALQKYITMMTEATTSENQKSA